MEESTSEIQNQDNISTCADIGDNEDAEQINSSKAEDGEVEEGEYISDEFEGADDE